MQTRPALIYQGLLLGLFVNGVMRWGFDSIIQTPAALGERGGGLGGSWWGATSPNVSAIVGERGENISFSWGGLPRDKGVDGVSILVDDVERWRGYVDAELNESEEGITLQRGRGSGGEPEFYRFAWMNGNAVGRYGGVGIWDQNGIWIPPRSWELGAK